MDSLQSVNHSGHRGSKMFMPKEQVSCKTKYFILKISLLKKKLLLIVTSFYLNLVYIFKLKDISF